MDIQRFVEDCLAANREKDAQAAVSEVLAKAISEPNKVLAAVGEPVKAGLTVLLKSPELTIFAASWTPQMNLMPHDHLMWASIGIYTGREDNIFWERTPDGIKAHRAEALFQKDTHYCRPMPCIRSQTPCCVSQAESISMVAISSARPEASGIRKHWKKNLLMVRSFAACSSERTKGWASSGHPDESEIETLPAAINGNQRFRTPAILR